MMIHENVTTKNFTSLIANLQMINFFAGVTLGVIRKVRKQKMTSSCVRKMNGIIWKIRRLKPLPPKSYVQDSLECCFQHLLLLADYAAELQTNTFSLSMFHFLNIYHLGSHFVFSFISFLFSTTLMCFSFCSI